MAMDRADPVERRDLARDGWCVVDLLDDVALGSLRAAFAELHDVARIPFFASHAALDPERRRRVSDAVLAAVGPALTTVQPEGAPFAAALLSKPAGTGAPLPFHQDLTYSDESVTRSYVCWAPLTDATGDAGVLRAVPGSHRWTTGIRPGGPNGMPTERFQDALLERSVAVPVLAGQAVIWDSAVVHGSEPNRSDRDRPVATIAFLERAQALTYFHRARDVATVEGYAVDDPFFFTPKPFLERPIGFEPVEPWAPAVAADDIAAGLGMVAAEPR